MWWDVVVAVARRDATLQSTYRFQLAMRWISTLFGVAVFFFIGQLVGEVSEPGLETGYFDFVLIGLLVISLASIGLREVPRTFTDEASSSTLEILLASPASLPSIIAGSLAVPFSLGAIDACLYLGIGFLLGGVGYSASGVLLAIPVLVLTISTFVAIGILSAAFLILTRRGEPFTILVIQTTHFLAGTLFPVALLPVSLQVAAHLLPAFYGLRAMRAVLLADAGLSAIWQDVSILLGFNLVLIPVSVWALNGALRVGRRLGTLASG